MVRFVTFALASTAWPAAPPAPPPPPAPPGRTAALPRCRQPLPRRSRNMARSASTLRAWTRASRRGDNFYRYANGTWAKNTPIPADKSNYGMFTVLDDLSRERTREIIEEQAKDPNSRIGAAYASFMDEAAVEAKGMAPIQPWLNQIRGLKSPLRPCRALRAGRAASASAPRSAASSVRTTRHPTNISCSLTRPASACPTAIIICRRIPSSPTPRRNISSI